MRPSECSFSYNGNLIILFNFVFVSTLFFRVRFEVASADAWPNNVWPLLHATLRAPPYCRLNSTTCRSQLGRPPVPARDAFFFNRDYSPLYLFLDVFPLPLFLLCCFILSFLLSRAPPLGLFSRSSVSRRPLPLVSCPSSLAPHLHPHATTPPAAPRFPRSLTSHARCLLALRVHRHVPE